MAAASGVRRLPPWVDYGLLPLLNLTVAFLIAGLVVVALGENPLEASGYLIRGAFGDPEMVSWTLFYATNFIFTGLAVAIAFHAGLFNIGAEGQAYIGGLGLTLVCLYLGDRHSSSFCRWPRSHRLHLARPGDLCRAGCRPSVAATSSSRPSCSISSPPRS